MSDTILVDGVPFEDQFRHLRFDGWGDVFTAGALRGGNYESPLADGEVWRRKRRAATLVPLSWSITPAGADVDTLMANANAEWFKLLRMFPRRRVVTLTRQIGVAREHGVDVVLQEAEVERVSEVAPNWLAHSYQDGVLTLRNLKGVWHDVESRTFTVQGGESLFVPATGTTDTANMTVELTYGGSAIQTLENVSAGVWLQYNWSGVDLSSRVVIDVPGFTVHRRVGGVDTPSLSRFSHGGDERFMVIDPDYGDNEFTLNTGSAVITYREAYL